MFWLLESLYQLKRYLKRLWNLFVKMPEKNVLACPKWVELEAQDQKEILETCLNIKKCTEEDFNSDM
jgi:hypothetical protein